jgi:hypothetical protein
MSFYLPIVYSDETYLSLKLLLLVRLLTPELVP